MIRSLSGDSRVHQPLIDSSYMTLGFNVGKQYLSSSLEVSHKVKVPFIAKDTLL